MASMVTAADSRIWLLQGMQGVLRTSSACHHVVNAKFQSLTDCIDSAALSMSLEQTYMRNGVSEQVK